MSELKRAADNGGLPLSNARLFGVSMLWFPTGSFILVLAASLSTAAVFSLATFVVMSILVVKQLSYWFRGSQIKRGVLIVALTWIATVFSFIAMFGLICAVVRVLRPVLVDVQCESARFWGSLFIVLLIGAGSAVAQAIYWIPLIQRQRPID